jgi:TfoX/Sxy family transcriptional regulator of competence genes
MPYDHFLAECIREVFGELRIEFEAKPMMGILCFMVNGRMCVGILDQRLIVRIDPDDKAAALNKPGCKPMYFIGRSMNDFMFIDPQGTRSHEQLLEWVEFALKCNREGDAQNNRSAAEKSPHRESESQHREENSDSAL